MMIDFFGTLPGLLSLAGAAVLLILISVVRRLRARAVAARTARETARAAGPGAARGSAAVGEAGPPHWLVAAVAAYAASGESAAPSADAWKPAVSWHDPWLAASGPGRRNLGVYK